MCKRYINPLPLARPPAGSLAHNPGMCPDREWNQQPSGSLAAAQFTEPHRSGTGNGSLKEIQKLVQGPAANKRQSWSFNPSLLSVKASAIMTYVLLCTT